MKIYNRDSERDTFRDLQPIFYDNKLKLENEYGFTGVTTIKIAS